MSRTAETVRRFDGEAPAVAAYFGEQGERYDRRAFGGRGMAHLSERDLRVVRAAAEAVPPGDALDVGVGTGRIGTELLAAGHRLTGVEASPRMIEVAARRLPGATLVEADLPGPLPLPDAAFDVVTCLRVLKYVRSWQRAIAELARLCRPGGVVCFDLANERSVAAFGYPPGMVWPVRLTDARTVIRAVGLTVVDLSPGVHLPDPVWRAASTARTAALARAAEGVVATVARSHGARSWTFTCRR